MRPPRAGPWIICAVLACSARAETIYQCDGPRGPVFSGIPCDTDARQLEPGDEALVLPGRDRGDGERLRRLREIREQRATPSRSRNSGEGLGFAERTELRRLRIRRDSLKRDLGTSIPGSRRERRTRRELEQVEQSIETLSRQE